MLKDFMNIIVRISYGKDGWMLTDVRKVQLAHRQVCGVAECCAN